MQKHEIDFFKSAVSLDFDKTKEMLEKHKFDFDSFRFERNHGFLFTFLRRFSEDDLILDNELFSKVISMIDLLMENGLKINKKTSTAHDCPELDLGNVLTTDIARGLETQNTEIAEYLLSKGANVNYIDNYGCIPLFFAKHTRLTELYLEKTEPKLIFKLNKNNENALFFHVKNLQSFKTLIDFGFGFHQKITNNDGDTILMHAIRYGAPETIAYLIDLQRKMKILDLNYLNPITEEPLFFAANQKKKIEILLKAGVNVNQIDKHNKNILFYCNSKNSVVKLLCKAGINVNQQDNLGNTILHYPESFSEELLDTILQYGFDLSLKNNQGDTVLSIFEKEAIKHLNNKNILNAIQIIKSKQVI